MALNKKIEFGRKCGVSTAYVAVSIKRGKIVVTKDGMVDDTNTTNIQFMKHCALRPKKTEMEPVELSESPEKTENPQKARISEKKSEAGTKEKDKYDERYDLENEKKRMEIEKLQREARLAEVQHLKLMGKMLPTDPVRTLYIQAIKAYTVAFKQAAEKIVMEFAAMNKMNRNDLAQMKGELISAINHAAEEGHAETKKSVNAIIREYSQAKK